MRCQDCHEPVDRFGSEVAVKHAPPPEYDYEPLTSARNSIRLLNLLSSSPENPQIECELIVKEFKDGALDTEYEALSWCWGTAKPNAYINIRQNGRMYAKHVAPDLVAALKALRHTQVDRCLWVDAVCINQENFAERNHQVEMMSAIYGLAKNVCIWLGEGDESSKVALDFIKKEVLQLQNFDELCESKEASSKWSALLDLMQRSWFSRRWVVQEIALARAAVIYCGIDEIPWKDFAVAVELFVEVETATHRLSEVMKKDPNFYHVPGWFEYVSALGASLLVEATGKLFRDYKVKGSTQLEADSIRLARRQPLLSLEYLVSSLSIFDVTVEHDAIYALLAIAKDTNPVASDHDGRLSLDRTKAVLEDFTQRKRYIVDYKQPYQDVCKTFIQFCIQQSDATRALDILCRPWAPEDKRNVGRRIMTNQQTAQDDDMPLPSWISQLSGAPYALYSHAGIHTLKMGRKNADMLVGIPTSTQRIYNAADTTGVDRKTLKFRKRPQSKHYSMYAKGFILDTVAEVLPSSQGGAIPHEWAVAGGWSDAPQTDPPDEFWRTLVADRGRDGRNPPVYYSRACKESFQKGGLLSGSVSTADLINNERCSVVAQFCRRVQGVIWNRSLIKTASGSLGLTGKSVLKGDCICILYGCSVPVILRQSNPKSEDEMNLENKEDHEYLAREYGQRWLKSHRRIKEARKRRPEENDEFHKELKWGRRWRQIIRQRKERTSRRAEFRRKMALPQRKTSGEDTIDKLTAMEDDGPAPAKDKFYFHEFLGECYVHGMMDGEAMAYQNQNTIKAQVFELR